MSIFKINNIFYNKNFNLMYIVVSIMFFLLCFIYADINAAIKMDDDKQAKDLITIYKFKMKGGSDSLRSLESLFPEVLKAYFIGLGWHATMESELGIREGKQAFPQQSKRPQTRTLKRMPESQLPGPGFIVRGSFFESKGILRISAEIEYKKTGETSDVTAQFDKRNILPGIESLGKNLEARMKDFLFKPFEGKKKTLAVRCFDFANLRSADRSDKYLTYVWMRREFAKFLSLAFEEIETVKVVKWADVEKICEAPLKDLLKKLGANLIVSGEYEMLEDESLKLRADIFDDSTEDSIGPIEMTGRLKDFFVLEKDFSELVREVLVLLLTPSEKSEVRNLFAADLDADTLVKTGVEFSRQGRKAIALWMYNRALKAESKLPSAHFEIGVIHEERESYKKAIEEFEIAVELKPNFSEALLHLGNIAIRRGDSAGAIEHYRRVIAVGDDLEVIAHLKLGDVYFLQNRFVDALSEYEAAREKDPYSADIYNALGLVSMAERNYLEAIPNLIRALRINPDHSEAHSNLAQAYYQYGEVLILESSKDPTENAKNEKLLEEAVLLLQQSIVLKESAEAYGRLAWAYSSLRKYTEAYTAAKEAVRLDPNYAWYHAGLGRILVELGKPEEAVKELNISVNLDPEHVFAHLYLGVAYKTLDNNELARDNFEKAWNLGFEKSDFRNAALAMDSASEIMPKNSLYLARSGEAYRMLGQYDKALAKLKRAVKIEPQPAWVYGSLGDVYRRKGDFKNAEENLKKAISLDPNSAWAYAHLGEAFSEQGDLDNAEENLKKAISLEPDSAWAYASLGDIYRQKGEFKKAIRNLEKAIALNSAYALAYASLGRVYSDKGNHEKAIAAIEKALELDPDFAWAYNELAVIMHENIFDYKEALRYASKAEDLESKAADKKNLIIYQSTVAEALVTAGRFDEAYKKTKEITSKTDENSIVLNMKMIQVVSLLLQKQEKVARSKVDAFIEFYEDLPKDFKNPWSYDGILHFLETQGELSVKEKDLLVSMIRLLRKEIDLSQFEAAFKKYYSREKISGVYFWSNNLAA